MNKSHRGEKCFADIVSAVYAFGGPVVGLQIWDKHGFNPLSIVTVCVCVCLSAVVIQVVSRCAAGVHEHIAAGSVGVVWDNPTWLPMIRCKSRIIQSA